MAGAFPRDQVDELLKACHRRCCICHRFCGVKIETDHIVPAADGGPDTIDNAIPVCFECHAEIHSYNDKHPRGRKFRPDELRMHKAQWLEICRTKPEIFVHAARISDVGPLQALIDELEFNIVVAENTTEMNCGCRLLEDQFKRAIQAGGVATLRDDLKQIVLKAYFEIGHANDLMSAIWLMSDPRQRASAKKNAAIAIGNTKATIHAACDSLLSFLSSD